MTEKAPGAAHVPDGSQPLPDGAVDPLQLASPDGMPSMFAENDPAADPGTGADGGTTSPDLTDTAAFPAVSPGDTIAFPAATDPASPEATTAESKDTAARYEDAVLLNRSYRVRRKIHEGGTESIRAWQWAGAKIANAKDTPGKYRRQFAHARANWSLGRKQDRLALAKNSVQWQARNRKVVAAQNKVDQRRLVRDQHVGHMEKRVRDVGENAERREQQYTEMLKVRKQNALLRKTVRQESDLSRYRRRDRRELEEMMRIIPAERLDSIARVAIESQTTTHLRKRAEKTERWANKRHTKAQGRATSISERIREYNDKVTEADEAVVKLNEVTLPEARERVRSLREELRGVGDDEEARTRLTTQLEEAEGEINDNVVSLSEWKKASTKYRGKSGRATKRSVGVHQALDRRRRFAEHASGRAEAWQETELDDQDALHDEVVVTLGPRRPANPHNADEERRAA